MIISTLYYLKQINIPITPSSMNKSIESMQSHISNDVEPKPKQQSSIKPIKISTNLPQYLNFMSYVKSTIKIQQFQHAFSKNRIFYSPLSFSSDICFVKLGESQNGAIVQLSVRISYFTCEILVLNLFQNPITFDKLRIIGNGANGCVFLAKDQKTFAIKSINYSRSSNTYHQATLKETILNQESIRKIIIEYCICKISSVLQIGPHVQKIFGFDLLIYNDFIQFSMELCSEKDAYNQIDLEQLKKSLKILHSIRIIHGDIKCQNIMWSWTYRKCVFVDFGLSKCINQQIGEVKLVKFFGTFSQCSDDMRKLYLDRSVGYVDLYFNDVYCLNKAFGSSTHNNIRRYLQSYENGINYQISQMQLFEPDKQYKQFIFNVKLKKHIFSKDIEGVEQLCRLYPYYQLFEDTLELLLQQRQSKKTKQICLTLQKTYQQACNLVKPNISLLSPLQSACSQDIKQKVLILKSRIKQIKIALNINNSFSDSIEYLKLFYHQDISTRSKHLKQKYFKLIQSRLYDRSSELFWIYVVRYLSNLFTNQSEILSLFQFLAPLLGIKEWEQSQYPQFNLMLRAFRVRQAVLQKYSIDLVKLHETNEYYLSQKYCTEMLEQDKDEQYTYRRIFEYQDKLMELIKLPSAQRFKRRKQLAKQLKQDIGSYIAHTSDSFGQLVYLHLLFQLEVDTKKVLELGQQIKAKLGNVELVQKSKISMFLLMTQLQQLFPFQKCFNQFRSILLQSQQNLYNYCFKPQYLCMSYFCLKIYHPFSCINSKPTINEKHIYQNLNTFHELSKSIRKYLDFNQCLRALYFQIQLDSKAGIQRPLLLNQIIYLFVTYVQAVKKQMKDQNSEMYQISANMGSVGVEDSENFQLSMRQCQAIIIKQTQYSRMLMMIQDLQQAAKTKNVVKLDKQWANVISHIEKGMQQRKEEYINIKTIYFYVAILVIGTQFKSQCRQQLHTIIQTITTLLREQHRNISQLQPQYYYFIRECICKYLIKSEQNYQKGLHYLLHQQTLIPVQIQTQMKMKMQMQIQMGNKNKMKECHLIAYFSVLNYIAFLQSIHSKVDIHQIIVILIKLFIRKQFLDVHANAVECSAVIEVIFSVFITCQTKQYQDQMFKHVIELFKICSYLYSICKYKPNFAWSRLLSKIKITTNTLNTISPQKQSSNSRIKKLSLLSEYRDHQYPTPLTSLTSVTPLISSRQSMPSKYKHWDMVRQKIMQRLWNIKQNKSKMIELDYLLSQNVGNIGAINVIKRFCFVINQNRVGNGKMSVYS